MAEQSKSKLPRRRKTAETVRQRADKQLQEKYAEPKNKRLKGKIYRPLSVLGRVAQKEYNPVRVPDNKAGRILGKKIHIIPKFIREAWGELRIVTWSTRREALRLTSAVIIFSVVFAIFIQIMDFIFSKLVKTILIK
jgi:preprotein translocase subunit SecE